MNDLTPENRYFCDLYAKAYRLVSRCQRKMDNTKPDSPAWQIAELKRQHYAEICVFLDVNSPTSINFCKYNKNK